MTIELSRFCVNRKTAPSLGLEAFFQAVSECGLNRVELRNDLPGGLITDGLRPDEVARLKDKYKIEIVTINALYPFNLPSSREELTARAREMLALARDLNCPALIMCPFNEADDRPGAKRLSDTVDSLKYLGDLFAEYGRQGLVEPLGFTSSSLRYALDAQKCLIEAASPFKMVIDTFHHHLSQVALEYFNAGIDVNMIGLVHLSGVEDARPTGQLTDEERIMLSAADVLKSADQVQNLEKLGYKGLYSFEPFASALTGWDAAKMKAEVSNSIDVLRQ